MSDVEEILRESIEDHCGTGGLMRFNVLYTGSFDTADGRPDLATIGAAVSEAFPADQAAAIMAEVTKKLKASRQTAKIHAAARAETPAAGGQIALTDYARRFTADTGHAWDIINEARRIRAAMGKPVPSCWSSCPGWTIPSPAPEGNAPACTMDAVAGREKAPGAGKPFTGYAPDAWTEAGPQPASIKATPLSGLDHEIRQFVYGTTHCTSIDILEFIWYLKGKGYSLQEYIVLEKIYITIEERKKKSRFIIEKEIEGLIDPMQAHEEPDIQGLLRWLREAEHIFEEDDVRRMVRDAVLRRA